MAVKYLSADSFKGKLVLVCINWSQESDQLPDAVKGLFEQYDDGALQDNAYFLNPKLVFSTGDGKKAMARLSNTALQVDRERTIYKVLFAIFSDIDDQAALLGMTVPELKAARANQTILGRLGLTPTKFAVIGGIVVLVVAVIGIIVARRSQ